VIRKFDFGFNAAVQSDAFYKLISKISAKDLIVLKNKEQIEIKAGRSRFGLACEAPEKLVIEKVNVLDHDHMRWKKIPADLKEALVFCCFSASKHMVVKPEFTGVFVKGNSVFSSDTLRITWYTLKDAIKSSFLVPARYIVNLNNYDISHFNIEHGWIHFKGKDLYFSICLLEEVYPAKKAIEYFPSIKKSEVINLPEDFDKVLDRALVLMEDDFILDKEVELVISKDSLICRLDKKQVGWYEEVVDIDRKGTEEVIIKINPIFLKEILKHTNKMILASESVVAFFSKDFKHLIRLGN
jgi:hypothetical protein